LQDLALVERLLLCLGRHHTFEGQLQEQDGVLLARITGG
jgi:hypothetical protein